MKSPDTGREPGAGPTSTEEDEEPAPVLSRLFLAATPFLLLLVLFILDRWIRG
jgi:hypothetical protein